VPDDRKPHVRLSFPHASVVGAHEPAAKRLYELIVRREEDGQLLRAGDLPGEPRTEERVVA
jgi:hypothetical protein